MALIDRGAGYAVVRTDKMMGTDVRSMLVSVKYFDGNGDEAEIQNGNVLKLDGLLSTTVGTNTFYEREIYKGVAVAANDAIDSIVLIASPEVIYDEHLHALDDYTNEAGKICRGYKLHKGDIFSITAPALATGSAATPAVGDIAELAAGTQITIVSTATSGSTTIGTVIAIDTVGKYTYYVIEVA